MNVLSLCHSSAPSPFGFTWSRTVTVARSWYFVVSGGTLRGPNRCANGEVLLVAERLVAEEEDEVVAERGAERRDRVVVERLAEVDARDLGADRGRERLTWIVVMAPTGRPRGGTEPEPIVSRP